MGTEGWIPWRRAAKPGKQEEEREEEPRPVRELYDIEWRETSFVPAGDNPGARLVFWKAEPGSASAGASELTDEEIEQVFDEVEKSEGRTGGGMTTQTFTKRADVFAEATRRAVELKKQEPETYGDKSLAAVRSAIFAADEHLREALAALPPEEPTEEPEPEVELVPVVEKAAAEPFAKIDRAAREAFPELYRRSPSAARSEIAKSLPEQTYAYNRAYGAR